MYLLVWLKWPRWQVHVVAEPGRDEGEARRDLPTLNTQQRRLMQEVARVIGSRWLPARKEAISCPYSIGPGGLKEERVEIRKQGSNTFKGQFPSRLERK